MPVLKDTLVDKMPDSWKTQGAEEVMDNYPNITYKRGCNPCNKKGKEYPQISYSPNKSSYLKEVQFPHKATKQYNIVRDPYSGEEYDYKEGQRFAEQKDFLKELPPHLRNVWVRPSSWKKMVEIYGSAYPTPQVGSCILYKFTKNISIIVGQWKDSMWQIRDLHTGELTHIPFDYIPASYSVIECPKGATFPPKPQLKVGDCAQWTYTKKGKVLTDRGTIIKIDGDEVILETEREIMGVKGLSFHDIYELSPCGKSNPSTYPEVSYSTLKETKGAEEAKCSKCGTIWDLETVRTRKDYVLGVCPKCGGKLRGIKLERPPGSLLYEPETECQLISPQYYDILTWLNVPVPDYSFAIEPEVKERKIDEVLARLKAGVDSIQSSSVFREFLTTMSKFWDYSIGNQILIMLQKPSATRVADFVTWKDLGRYVKAGEKGIAILAPCLPPRAIRWAVRTATGLATVRQWPDGKWRLTPPYPDTERQEFKTKQEALGALAKYGEIEEISPEEISPTYFKVVYVFDVSQTEGKPLPEVKVPVLTGAYSKELYDKLMGLAAKQGLTVSFEPQPGLSPEIKGSLLGTSIWIKPDEPEAQRLKTLGHELAHYYTEHVYFIPRADAEVIAESVAFTVCAHFGFDTGTRSFPYVALWAKEKKVLEQNLATIRKISGKMIEELGE